MPHPRSAPRAGGSTAAAAGLLALASAVAWAQGPPRPAARPPALPAAPATASAAQPLPALMPASPPQARQRIQRLQLANGLDVLLVDDRRLPRVALNLWLHAGPRHEGPGQVGMGFLTEHVLFSGSRHIPRGRADVLVDAAGGTEFVGNTSFERSAYSLVLPAHQLELGLWVLADMLGWSFETLDAAALAELQAGMRQARRRNVEQRPYGLADEALHAALFPPGHPYRAAVIGSHADIQAFTLEGVRDFARQLVRPNNATLVLAGDFDTARVRSLVQRHFGSLRPGPAVLPRPVAQPRITSPQRLTVTDAVELPRLTLAWHTPAAFQPGDAELEVAAAVLGGGPTGRLARALIQQQGLAASVDVSQSSLSLGSIFSIEVVARPGVSLQALEAALDEELAALAANGPSEADVQRASAGVQTRLLHRVDRPAGLAEQLNLYQRLAGQPAFLERDLQRYRQSTPESVRQAVAQHLRPEARVVLHTVPGERQLPPEPPALPAAAARQAAAPGAEPRVVLNPAEPWRLAPPPPAAALPLAGPPDGQRQQLPNGLMVVHVPAPGLPLVIATLVLRAGMDRSPPERPGLASFTAALLDQGTRDRSTAELAQAAALLGGSLAVDFGAEDLRITVAAMPQHLHDALNLVAEMVLRPAFGAEALAAMKLQRLDALARERGAPGSAADLAARAAFFGSQHPLADSRLGNAQHIEATTRNEVLAFWRATYRPDDAALVISGDIDQPSALRLARLAFGGWRAPPGNTPPWQPPQPRPAAAGVLLLDAPGAAEASLQWMAPAPTPDSPEAAAASVLHSALAAMPGALLPAALATLGRQRRRQPAPGPQPGRLGAARQPACPGAGARPAGAAGADARPAPAAAGARAAAAGARCRRAGPARRPRDAGRPSPRRLASLWAQDMPSDHLARWPQQLAAVGAAQLQQLARRMLDPAGMRLVVVGDAARLQAALQAAAQAHGLGPVQTLLARDAAPLALDGSLPPAAVATPDATPQPPAGTSPAPPSQPLEPRTP